MQQPDAPSFLCPLPSLEALHMGAKIAAAAGRTASAHLVLADGVLLRSPEVKASRVGQGMWLHNMAFGVWRWSQ